ncbi:MAG: glycerol-3-phosphate 1-O-acyltransferase PlsY [Clostridia bacterium]|nr:glycerol-3-phosphate 1-O-acyltransferase PlsY [Clostridia bacterium]
MLQFFDWFWKAIGLTQKLGIPENNSFQGFIDYFWKTWMAEGKTSTAILLFIGGIVFLIVVPYLLGSLNGAILVSKYIYHDDIRNHGSGNAGLTNMGRVFGKKGAILTLVIDIAKQFVSVLIGIVLWGEVGSYLAGLFCMIGHIAPVFFKFKGGKGVLTAAVMILMIDYQVFLIAFAIFALVVLISRYVSLGSVIAGFALPGIVWLLSAIRGRPAHPFALFFAVLIGLMLILMHRSNIKRLYEGNENKLSFKKKKKPEEDTDNSGEEKSGKEKKKK